MQTQIKREEGCKRCKEHTHFFFSSRILYTQRLNPTRRAVLELYSRPCALSSPILWMDGWRTEPNVST